MYMVLPGNKLVCMEVAKRQMDGVHGVINFNIGSMQKKNLPIYKINPSSNEKTQ